MKRKRIGALVALIGFCSSLGANAAEFSYEQVLPIVESLTFLDDSIVVRTSSKNGIPMLRAKAFVIDRNVRIANPITLIEANELTGQHDSAPTNVPIRHDTRSRTTLDGTPYTVRDVSCSVRGGEPTSRITFDSKDVEIQMNSCSSFDAIESTDAHLWIGTYNEGSRGSYAAEKLLVIDRKTGGLATVVDTGSLAILGVVRDPVNDEIWSVTANQITIMSANLRHRYKMQFYHDFNVETGEPEIRLAAGSHYSNPLAVIARHLPEKQRPHFCQQVKNIPDSIVSSFSLYDFYMCCSLSRTGEKPLPPEFNVLVPFIRIGVEHSVETIPGFPGLWGQLACRLDHADAKAICAGERIVY